MILLGLCSTLTSMLSYVMIAGVAFWYLPVMRISHRFLDMSTFREIRGYSMKSFLNMVAGRICFQSDALVIGLFQGPEWVAYYLIGLRIYEYTKSMFHSITGVLTPFVSQRESVGDKNSIRSILLSARFSLVVHRSP